ncbi:hypothetical protein [Amycolatopsis sp. NPDC003861]
MDLLRPYDPLVSAYAGQALAKVRIRLHGSREARKPRPVLRLRTGGELELTVSAGQGG